MAQGPPQSVLNEAECMESDLTENVPSLAIPVITTVTCGQPSIDKKKKPEAKGKVIEKARNQLFKELTAPSSSLVNKLLEKYCLWGVAGRKNPLTILLNPKSQSTVNQIKTDLDSGHLVRMITSCVPLSHLGYQVDLSLKLDQDRYNAVYCAFLITPGVEINANSAAANQRSSPSPPAPSSDGYFPLSGMGTTVQNDLFDPIKPAAAVTTTRELTTNDINITEEISQLIRDTKRTAYDFHDYLVKNKNDIRPAMVIDNRGNNMLHMCVFYRRASHLEVIHRHGWWLLLIEMQSPHDERAEYPGCSPMEMARKMRVPRTRMEIERLNKLEESMNRERGFLRAVRDGALTEIRSAFDRNNKLDVRSIKDDEGSGPVHWACVFGTLDHLKLLREKRADMTLVNNSGQTALHIAAKWGNQSVVKYLLRDCRIDGNIRDKAGRTATEYAAMNGDKDTIDKMLECGMKLEPISLILASFLGRMEFLKHVHLTVHGSNFYGRDKDGKTCLMVAVEQGQIEVVQFLLDDFRFKLDEQNNQGRNVFHFVAEKGTREMAEKLIEKAATQDLLPRVLNMKDKHRVDQMISVIRGLDGGRPGWHHIHLRRQTTPWFSRVTKGGSVDARRSGHVIESGWGDQPTPDILKQTIETYKNENRTKHGCDDMIPLHIALLKKNILVARLLIAAGSSIHTKDCFGLQPVHFAAMNGCKEVVSAFMACGVSASVTDEESKTPEQVALDNDEIEMSQFLKSDSHIQLAQDLVRKLQRGIEELDHTKLTATRSRGQDVRRHIIDSGRQLQNEITQVLRAIGSGPVVQEGGGDDENPPSGLPQTSSTIMSETSISHSSMQST